MVVDLCWLGPPSLLTSITWDWLPKSKDISMPKEMYEIAHPFETLQYPSEFVCC
jgi:hypothetical protein